jgi:hypothetical protein
MRFRRLRDHIGDVSDSAGAISAASMTAPTTPKAAGPPVSTSKKRKNTTDDDDATAEKPDAKKSMIVKAESDDKGKDEAKVKLEDDESPKRNTRGKTTAYQELDEESHDASASPGHPKVLAMGLDGPADDYIPRNNDAAAMTDNFVPSSDADIDYIMSETDWEEPVKKSRASRKRKRLATGKYAQSLPGKVTKTIREPKRNARRKAVKSLPAHVTQTIKRTPSGVFVGAVPNVQLRYDWDVDSEGSTTAITTPRESSEYETLDLKPAVAARKTKSALVKTLEPKPAATKSEPAMRKSAMLETRTDGLLRKCDLSDTSGDYYTAAEDILDDIKLAVDVVKSIEKDKPETRVRFVEMATHPRLIWQETKPARRGWFGTLTGFFKK